MAQAVLSAFLQVVFDNLASPIMKEFGSLWAVDKELKKFSRTLLRIRSVLNDAEERQITDEAVQIWLGDLKDVAYDADDIVDEFATAVLQAKVEGGIQIDAMQQVCNFISSSINQKQVLFRSHIAHELNEIRERLDEIANEWDDLSLREAIGERKFKIRDLRETSSVIEESDSLGREDDRKKIIKLLEMVECNGKNVSVISIVGMGGLGKTTLAQLVYNDERVKDHFEIRAWVHVSEEFDVRRLTKAIIESAARRTYDFKELDPLQVSLKEILNGKRFLLVLDDVWNENHGEWDVLRAPLSIGAKGSKILVTTRSEIVSKIMGPVSSHHLKGLSDNNCWSLFRKRVFTEEIWDAHPKLVLVGKKIIKKCKGSPLVAKTLGGLLQSEVDEDKWNDILTSSICELPKEKNHILRALRLSYHHLPPHLKQCFAYCSIFPKDFTFKKNKLVQLWMGEGFIQPQGSKQMEDIGRCYFDDLLWRSLFQYHHNDQDNNQSTYKMHDLFHDLAQSVSGHECFRMEDDMLLHISDKAHRSSWLFTKIDPMILETFYKFKSLRTLVLLQCGKNPIISQVLDDIFLKLRCLRVLDLSDTIIAELPNSISNLKHLRYLDLSRTPMERLPESMCSLYNLQTLNLINCSKLLELPKDMSNLINLRHLALDRESELISTLWGIGRLKCLQTLSMFIVDRKSGLGIEELKGLTNLSGELCISKLENVVNAKEAELKNKKYLQKLKLRWSDGIVNLQDAGVEEILEGLRPHSNLKHLEIKNYGGERFPSWMGDSSFSNLTNIHLSKCRKCHMLPPLGQLPFLENLYVSSMDAVKHVSREFYGDGTIRGFPSLEMLSITIMPNLEEWCEVEQGEMSRLRKLTINTCLKVKELPAISRLSSLHDLELCSCNETILSSLPYLTSLSSLRISEFRKLKIIPNGFFQHLTALKELAISFCDELMTLPNCEEMKHLRSLKELTIRKCPQLMSLPEGLSTTLKFFKVDACHNLMSLPKCLSNLTSLESIEIWKCPQLKFLPEGLKNLNALQNLEIWNCSGLANLPNEGLPTALQVLTIAGCPLLENRCQEGGEDWPKIAHIPNIWINGRQIYPS